MVQTQLVIRYAQGRWILGRPNYAFLAFRTKQAAVRFGRVLTERLENAALVVRPKAVRHR